MPEKGLGLCILVVPLIRIFISYNSRFISHMAFTDQVTGLKTNLDAELNTSQIRQMANLKSCVWN